MEFSATALGKASGGTRFGVTAALAGIQKARPGAEYPHHREDRPHRTQSSEREPGQNACTKRRHRVGGNQDEPPVGVIGHVATRKHEHHERQELHQAQVPEIQWVMRERIHLPANGDAHICQQSVVQNLAAA